MSKSLNKVILIGNLGADPEVRSTSNGGRVATLSVATGRQWKGGQSLADVVEKYTKKGDKVYIEGSIEYRSWQDKDGQTKYTTEITARELILLSGKGEGGEGGGGGGNWSGGRSASAAPKAASGGAAAKANSFNDMPDALDAEDDDLPF